MSCQLIFFFFQAEDGIRDGHVTGVQTCALPIYDEAQRLAGLLDERRQETRRLETAMDQREQALEDIDRSLADRSEERRVGKESRARWSADEAKTKRRARNCERRSGRTSTSDEEI